MNGRSQVATSSNVVTQSQPVYKGSTAAPSALLVGSADWSLSTIIIRNESGTLDYGSQLMAINETNGSGDVGGSGRVAATNISTGPTGDSGVGGGGVNAEYLENYKYWSQIVLIICFCLFIIITVIGNTLVILSVITTRRLRTVTNCFVMSLAVADWLVGVFVMPPAVAYYFMSKYPMPCDNFPLPDQPSNHPPLTILCCIHRLA